MTPAPVIRPAEDRDAESMAAVIAVALHEKYRPALGRHAERGLVELARRDIARAPASRYWVAEIDGRIAGAVHLTLSDPSARAFLAAVAADLGWPRALRAAAVFALLGSGRIAPDEAYIDELGVAAWARRRGLARALLEACARAAEEAGRTRLTLMVTSDNAPARALYGATGFRETERRTWRLARRVFGAPGALIMERRLPST